MNPQKTPKRHIDGIVLLDKPEGITSNAALQQVKHLYRAMKAGHTGSLDPLASGMLPICLGEATKFSQYLLDADKSYQVTAQLGVKTTTGDREGEVVSQAAVPELTQETLEAVLKQFTGQVTQIPSMYSALKHQGQPLYKLARQGIEVERKARVITVYQMDLLGIEGDLLSIQVSCSKGTYIRTLVEDIGTALGCGAHVAILRRLGVGSYLSAQMHTLDELQQLAEDEVRRRELDTRLLPFESAIGHFAELSLSEAAIYYLKQGQAIIAPQAPSEGWVRLHRRNTGAFVGVGEVLADGRVAPRRLMAQL